MSRHLLAWLPMVVLAVLNGAVRDFTYGKAMSAQAAHQLSTLALVVVFALYTAFLHAKWPLRSRREAFGVGAAWLVLTVAFEFALGRLASGQSWEEMLAAYDLRTGSWWILVPLAVAVLPAAMQALVRPGAAR